MRELTLPLVACAALVSAVAALAPGARADGAAGSVSGTIVARSGGRPPERLVVYLEPSTSTAPITGTAAVAPSSAGAGSDFSTSAGAGWERRLPGARAAGAQRVSMREARFTPDLLVAVLGEPVVFSNDEPLDVTHDAYALSRENRLDTGLMARGERREVRFAAPGCATVYCSLHPDQEMTVLVVPSRLHALPSVDGAFEVRDVPPGRWTVRTLQARPRWREGARDVIVEAGRAAQADVELSR